MGDKTMYGMIDSDGKMVLDYQLEELFFFDVEDESQKKPGAYNIPKVPGINKIAVEEQIGKGKKMTTIVKYGVANRKGEIIVPAIYQSVTTPSNTKHSIIVETFEGGTDYLMVKFY